MKTDQDELKPLLQGWSEVPAPSGRLAGPVWQRIEQTGGRAGWLAKLTMVIHELDARFARPGVIAAVLFVSVLAGVGVAEMRTVYDAHQVDTEMSARYLSMLDTGNR